MLFSGDIDTTKASKLLSINRNTVNAIFCVFRELIYGKQSSDKKLFFGEIELDEAYLESKNYEL